MTVTPKAPDSLDGLIADLHRRADELDVAAKVHHAHGWKASEALATAFTGFALEFRQIAYRLAALKDPPIVTPP